MPTVCRRKVPVSGVIPRYRRDCTLTVCDSAKEACPVFPGSKQMLHWPFDDPAHAIGSGEEARSAFRRARKEIADRIQSYLDADQASHAAT
jgi:protein-tyrosine-phosphatase